MKIARKVAVTLAIVCLASACGGGGVDEDAPYPSGSGSGVPTAIKGLLDSKCDVRPSPIQQGEDVGGQQLGYTEVLAEQDDGSVVEEGSKLLVKNLNGLLYVEPSSDGKVYWAARKWTLSETQENAESELGNVAISSGVADSEVKIEVSQPASTLPGTRYEVCLVAMVPSEWAQSSNNGSGDIEIQGISGDVVIENVSGDVFVTQHAVGSVAVTTQSGDISIDTASDKEVIASSQSGDITINTKGSGKITSTNASGDILVNADSKVAVDLSNQSGGVYYTLTNGGVSYQYDSIVSTESGSVVLNLADGFGLRLDAEVLTGSIEVPEGFPAPESSGVTGERLVADINGGGATLTIRSTTGTISIEALN